MKDDWLIWIGMLSIGLNFMLFGFAYLQMSNMWWYYQYIIGGDMFCIGLFIVGYCIKTIIVKPNVHRSKEK